MHAVARAVDVAAKQPLVRLHQFGRLFRDGTTDGTRKTPVAPEAADVERIADDGLDQLQPRLRPLPGVKRDRDAALEQRLERTFDEALRAPVRRVALPDDGQSHYAPSRPVAARTSFSAACTRSTGSVVRHSEILPPPHPSMPQGRHGCVADATTRCGTPQGPHSSFAARPEQRHDRRTHRRGDVHGGRVDADEGARFARERGQFAQRKRASQVDDAWTRRARARGKDGFDECALAGFRRAGNGDAQAGRRQPVEQSCGVFRWPALEQPARPRVHLDESMRLQALLSEQIAHARGRLVIGAQHQALVRRRRLQPDAPQRVEVAFDGVARRGARQPVVVREGRAPKPMRAVQMPSHRIAWLEQAGEPRAARVLGQVHDQIVASSREVAQEPSFRGRLREPALSLPFAVDRMKCGDRRVTFEHRCGFTVDERVDFGGRHGALEHREHRRREQDVAMMAQLGDQHAADHGGVDRVLQRVEHALTIAKCPV